MDLRTIVRLLRDHWKLIVLVTALAGGGSAALTARMTPHYASSVTLYVSAETSTTDPLMAYEAALLSAQTVQSYADILTGPRLASSVINALHLPMTTPQLAAEISARPIPQTVLLTATVTDTKPQRAQLIAASVGTQFAKLVSTLARAPGQKHATVRVTVVAPASLSSHPVSPNPVRNIGIATALGLLIGLALAAGRRSLDTTINCSGHAMAHRSQQIHNVSPVSGWLFRRGAPR